MSPNFEEILDDCITRLREGQSLEECLQAYLSHADQLRPLLIVASRIQNIAVPQERPEAVRSGRNRLVAAQSNLFKSGKISRSGVLALRFALTLTIVLLITAVMTLNVSAKSVPGDPFYGIKRTLEETRLLLTTNPEAREKLVLQYSHDRYNEMQELIQDHRTAELDFEARIESIAPEQWTVGKFILILDAETTIIGQPAIGRLAHVRAQLRKDGTLVALRIQVIQPEGKISEPTEGPPYTSEPSESQESTQETGQFEGSSTPTPTSESRVGGSEPTATPTPTSPPQPTATPTPTDGDPEGHSETPHPSKTPQPTRTPSPSEPAPTEFPSPTPSSSPIGVASPTATPTATKTPKPSRTPTPTPTPTHEESD